MSLMRLLVTNLRTRWQEWRQRQHDGDTWTRLRALWEGK